ncbi:hypothetical protein M8J76_016782 [Diaphorina citri]|nr:hypothetical protein M8J76_016782 [Diaphorina citri]
MKNCVSVVTLVILSVIVATQAKPLDAHDADIDIDDTRAQKDIVLDISKNKNENAEIILKKYEEKIPDSEIIEEANVVGTSGDETKQCNCFHGKKTDMLETQVKQLRNQVEQDSNTSKYIIGMSLLFYFCICVYYWFHSYF